MARYYVTHNGPHELAPLTMGGSYRAWDELQVEPIGEWHWYETRGDALPPPDRTLSEKEAREGAYRLVQSLNGVQVSEDAYRRRK
jgi:hypothetical protein